jgi:flotillin
VRAETGRAQGQALQALLGAWKAAGDSANEIFLIQQIDRILADVAAVTSRLQVEHVNLIDGGDGRTLARHVGSYPAVVAEILERIKETVGIDIVSTLTNTKSSLVQGQVR